MVDVKIFNILVHYGEKDEFNLLDLLDAVLLENLLGGETVHLKEYMYPFQVKKIKRGKKYFLTGYFYKSATLKWVTIPDGETRQHKIDPGSKKVLPFARFYLDLAEHRLFWITQRGISASPSAYQFCSYIKKSSLPSLREEFKKQGEIEWTKTSRGARGKSKNAFISKFLSDRRLSNRTFKVELNPEVSYSKIRAILERKSYQIRHAVFYPKQNNVTKQQVRQLFSTVGDLASEMKGMSEIKIDPELKKHGLAKNPLFDLLEQNESEQLLNFQFTIKDTDHPSSRTFVIANSDTAGQQKIQKVETLNNGINDPSLLTKIFDKVGKLKNRALSAENRRKMLKKLERLIE